MGVPKKGGGKNWGGGAELPSRPQKPRKSKGKWRVARGGTRRLLLCFLERWIRNLQGTEKRKRKKGSQRREWGNAENDCMWKAHQTGVLTEKKKAKKRKIGKGKE